MSHWIPPPLSRFGEYRAIDDDFDVPQMKHTLRWAREIYVKKGWLDSFTDYQALIAAIRELPDSEVVPMRELMRTPAGNVRRLALRYDIDVDPYTALQLARYNARYALCGSFYLLHSSYYYGVFAEGVLHRNPLLREWATALSVAGCELGLHTDPLALYFEHGVDGADGVRQELAWLRSQGVPIEGTVAHNSLPLYGAENLKSSATGRCGPHPAAMEGTARPPRHPRRSVVGAHLRGQFPHARVSVAHQGRPPLVAGSPGGGRPRRAVDAALLGRYLLPAGVRSHGVAPRWRALDAACALPQGGCELALANLLAGDDCRARTVAGWYTDRHRNASGVFLGRCRRTE